MATRRGAAYPPAYSDDAVVFRGDGEPSTPATMAARLADIAATRGIAPDSYSLGGVVEELEAKMAAVLGKEAAVFMPSGTLANHLAIRKLCGERPRAIVQEQSHLYNDTGDCVQRLSGINLIALAQGGVCFTLDDVCRAVDMARGGRVSNPIGALMIESPVRRQFGQTAPIEDMKAITDYCRAENIGTHLDGARLFMSSAASGVPPAEYAAMFDTVYVSLYKYLAAPFGAILAGTRELCAEMFQDRRMFGGGLASSALAAALALNELEDFQNRFAQAMSKAKELFAQLDRLGGVRVKTYARGSNIFRMELAQKVDPERFREKMAERNVWIFPEANAIDQANAIHITVNTTILRQPNSDIEDAFQFALSVP